MWSRFGYGYGYSPAVRRGFSLGFTVLPFLVFLALNAVWTPHGSIAWAAQVSSSVIIGWLIGWVLLRGYHRLFDARPPE